MALGLFSGASNALVSKVAIGAVIVAGLGGAATKFVPPPSQDVAIWFDQPITKQHIAKGPFNLALHVGRGEYAKTVRVDVAFNGTGGGPTLTTDDITMPVADKFADAPYEPEGLQSAVIVWNAVPGTYKLTPSFTSGGGWTKGNPITVTVDGEPKPDAGGAGAEPTPTESLEPGETPPTEVLPTDLPTVDPSDLDPGGPGPTNTLPPPPEPVFPPSAISTASRTIGSHPTYEYWYRFRASAISPANASVTLRVRQSSGSSSYASYPCGNFSADDVSPSKRQCFYDWESSGGIGYTVQVSYYFVVQANGQTFTTPVKSFEAGKPNT